MVRVLVCHAKGCRFNSCFPRIFSHFMKINNYISFFSKKLQNQKKFCFFRDGSTFLNFKKNTIFLIKRNFLLIQTWSELKKLQ